MEKTENKIGKLHLGEIFQYQVRYKDEDGQECNDEKQAFFIKVDNSYFLINIDPESKEFLFFDEIIGVSDKPKEGNSAFTFIEALRFIKAKSPKGTNKYITL